MQNKTSFYKISILRSQQIDFRCLKSLQMIPNQTKTSGKKQFFKNKYTTVIFLSKATILTLLKLVNLIKNDRTSILDLGGLDITSGSLLKLPFMPKQGPRSSTVQYCTELHSTVQYCPHPSPVSLEIQAPSHPSKN